MKQVYLLCIIWLTLFTPSLLHGQIKIGGETRTPTTSYSYATAYLKIDSSTHEVHLNVHITGSFREASVHFPANTDAQLIAQCDAFIKTCRRSNELLNWMGQKGWKFVSSETVESTTQDASTYLQILIFEKVN